jgi:fatty-acyl-CoA synthase
MTEASGTVVCMPVDISLIEENLAASGLVPPEVEVKIVDDTEQEVAPGVAGEVLVRGSNVSSGYWRRPAETAAAFTPDGWYRSGDIGRLDENGFLHLVDRKKDMFISGGENVYPAEIESALAGYEDIAECAVVGVADERWGEVGHLAVAPWPGRALCEAEIIAYLEARLARYKIPKHITIMETLPRNGAGKLVKAVLKKALLETA